MTIDIPKETEIARYLEDARGFREQDSIDKITKLLRDYRCCTILGPLYSHKSILLEHVCAEVQTMLKRTTVLVSVRDVDCVTSGRPYEVGEFLRGFGKLVSTQLEQLIEPQSVEKSSSIMDEFTLTRHLIYCQHALTSDLVLLVDHLESARLRSLESLLRVLRAFFTQGQVNRRKRPVIAAASSHRVASLSLGAGSPFNIAIPFIVQDLSYEESKRWIRYLSDKRDTTISNAAIKKLWRAAGGDRYLLRELLVYSTETVSASGIGPTQIRSSVVRFEKRIESYAPIRATVRTIEDNPALLITLLELLSPKNTAGDPLPRSSSTVDDVNLSGGMICDPKNDPPLRIRNQIYGNYLTRYFKPPRAAEVLAHNRRWDHAIAHLARFPEHFSYLKEIVLKAVSSSSSFDEATRYVDYFLRYRFGLKDFAVFIPQIKEEPVLFRGSHLSATHALFEEWLTERPPDNASPQQGLNIQKGRNPQGAGFLLFNLVDGADKLMSLALFDSQPDDGDEESPELARFLSETAHSLSRLRTELARVGSYARDASVWSQASGLLDPDRYLQEIIKAAMQVVPATKGSLYLWDFDHNKLIVRAQHGFPEDLVDEIHLNKGEGYAGWVFQNKQPVIIDNVWQDERTRRFENQEIKDLQAAICVPLQVWDHVFGVLCLDTTETGRAFNKDDLSSLIAFADHAVQVILSHRLRQEFYDLSLVLNRHDVDEQQIFKFVVNSILRVFGAVAASMLLLADADEPAYSLAQKPLMIEAEGLSASYKDHFVLRPNGLTHQALVSKKAAYVSRPDDPPGINPQAFADGIRAQLFVPLALDEEISGVLSVHYDRPHQFAPAEIRMMTLIANQVSLAISNVRQRRELELTDKVVWMGLKWPDLGHDFTQSVGSFENSLKELVGRTRSGSNEETAMKAIIGRVGELKEELLRIVSDPYDHKPELVDLSELLKEQIERYLKICPAVTLDFDCNGCPKVTLDPRWFEIIVKNVISNSVKAMENESHKRLSVRCVHHGRRVTVKILNTGLPIPPRLKAILFLEPIFNRSKRRYGIGLFVTARIISRYKGRIWIDGNGPEGVTVAFSLPTMTQEGDSATETPDSSFVPG